MLVFGARRVGKTVLVKEILSEINEPVLVLNGEHMNSRRLIGLKNERGIFLDMNLNGRKRKLKYLHNGKVPIQKQHLK